MKKHLTLFALALATLVVPTSVMAAKITIVNNNGPGVGFNDPTPATPVGGNTGTTLGAQRLIAFQEAARLWSLVLDSDVEIKIDSSFASLACTATSATLGQTATNRYLANFPNAPKTNTWYPVALASALAKSDQGSGDAVMTITFTTYDVPGCAFAWYYGLDGNHPTDKEDLVVTALHEFAHGFGFAGPTDTRTGRQLESTNKGTFYPGIWDHYTLDTATGLHWKDETTAQRVTSVTSTNKLVWDGAKAKTSAAKLLTHLNAFFSLDSPASIAKQPAFTIGAFSGLFTVAGASTSVVQALDPADSTGMSTTDACSPLTNLTAIAGKIALVDRGSCAFVIKAKNVQNAGALAMLVVDNATDGTALITMGGSDSTLVIPSIMITHADGEPIKAQLAGGVRATIRGDSSKPAQGLDDQKNVLLYSPSTFSGGSSVYHWDVSASPNLLMEPNISAELTHGPDITIDQLTEIGWTSNSSTNGGSPEPAPFVGRTNIKRNKH